MDKQNKIPQQPSTFEGLPVVDDDEELLRKGIVRVPLPETLDAERWAEELSQVTPMNLMFEGDGEYAFYRNILDEPEFPFDLMLLGSNNGQLSEIGRAILRYFPVLPGSNSLEESSEILSKELKLDDAFCVHYNMDQDDTTGAKHVDPSDITVNMCLQKASDTTGSYVLFHGTKSLEGLGENSSSKTKSTETISSNNENRFLVPQTPGTATVHFGDHPHETTALRTGSRTNIILTYLYTDPTRSDAATRSCYGFT